MLKGQAMLKAWQSKRQASRYEMMPELPLIQAVVNAAPGAWEAFVARYGNAIYTLCATVFAPEELEAECLTMFAGLRDDHCAVLRAFDGRATLTTYLTLILSNRLAQQVLALFERDADRAWQAFERFFRKDIIQVIATYFPPGRDTRADGDTADDRYQEVCLLLIEQDYRRLKAYNGRGSLAGYIRGVVRHLCVDLVRKEEGRRRLPEGIAQLPVLEQEVFKFIYWEGHEEEAGRRVLLSQGYLPEHAEAALSRIRLAIGLARPRPARPSQVSLSTTEQDDNTARQLEISDMTFNPEQTLLEVEAYDAQTQMLAVLQEAVEQLPADEQHFVRLRYLTTPQLPPRDIARQLERPIDDIYKLGRQAVSHLQAYLKARGVESMA